MFQDLIFSSDVLQPTEAALLREATRLAIDLAGTAHGLSEEQRQRLAGDVISIARSGYTRTTDGTLDATSLAEAAVLRFQSFAAAEGSASD